MGEGTTETARGLTLDERLTVLGERRRAVLREREGLIIDYAVQRALEAPEDAFRRIEDGLRRCEVALRVLDGLADEWKEQGNGKRAD